jgi:tetratricopeptide (TPR) repeat protein
MSEKKRVLEGQRSALRSRACFAGCLLNALAIVHGVSAQNAALPLESDDRHARPSNADAPSALGPTERYQVLVDEALTEYERGDWEEAAALFGRAHALQPSARTLRGLGLSAFEARHYADAMRYLSAALSDTRRALTAKQRDEVGATLERAKLFAGYLTLRLEPSTATSSLNGRPLELAPDGGVAVDPGWLDLEVKADGYEPLMRHIRVGAGERQVIDAHLTPTPSTAAIPTASIPAATRADMGTGARETTATSALSSWKWVSSAAALAALGAGTALLITQKVRARTYVTECIQNLMPQPDCVSRRDSLGSDSFLWTGSIVGLSAGAGLAALSVVLFALDARPSERERATLRACSAGPTSIACRWQF